MFIFVFCPKLLIFHCPGGFCMVGSAFTRHADWGQSVEPEIQVRVQVQVWVKGNIRDGDSIELRGGPCVFLLSIHMRSIITQLHSSCLESVQRLQYTEEKKKEKENTFFFFLKKQNYPSFVGLIKFLSLPYLVCQVEFPFGLHHSLDLHNIYCVPSNSGKSEADSCMISIVLNSTRSPT